MSGATTQRASADVHHRVADHAATGSLRDLLEYHRLSYAPEPLSEGTIFGLSGALDLRLRIGEQPAAMLDLDGRATSLEIDLCRHIGLRAEWCETDDYASGWEMLALELDAGRPTLLRADVGEIDYHAERRHDTRHAIVVTGYDSATGVATVLDGRFPDQQQCSLSSLAAARASRGVPAPARHGLLRLRPGDPLAAPRPAIRAAVARVVHNMRRARRMDQLEIRCGLDAIDALATAWPRLPETAGPDLARTLQKLCQRIRDGANGGTLYRSLQARFEHDAAALLGSAQLGRTALVCDDLVDAWRTFAAAIDDEDADRAHTVGRPWLDRVRSLEHRHVEGLQVHLGTGGRAFA
ncbi:MAG: BtrH N-terminal domain-containing protein [Solirubrobacteraceae bacterium]